MMTTVAPKIKCERVPNPVIRDFHLNTKISEDPIQRFEMPLRDSSEEYLEKVGELGTSLIRQLAEVPGIKGITIGLYNVHVEIGEAFSWLGDGIEQQITEILKGGFPEEIRDQVEVCASYFDHMKWRPGGSSEDPLLRHRHIEELSTPEEKPDVATDKPQQSSEDADSSYDDNEWFDSFPSSVFGAIEEEERNS